MAPESTTSTVCELEPTSCKIHTIFITIYVCSSLSILYQIKAIIFLKYARELRIFALRGKEL